MPKSLVQMSSAINRRFDHLLLSLDDAIMLAGKKTANQVMYEDSEQASPRRQLLMIEQVAVKHREDYKSALMTYMQQVEAKFHRTLEEQLIEAFKDVDLLLTKYARLSTQVAPLLDTLYADACTISKLDEHMSELNWLQRSLKDFVQQPQYQRQSGVHANLDTNRAVLAFIGLEGLRMLLPALVSKHIIAKDDKHFQQLETNLWRYSLGTAKCCRRLAELNQQNKIQAYCMGFFADLGRNVITKLYLERFEQLKEEQTRYAVDNGNPKQAQTLHALKPSTNYLVAFWAHYSFYVCINLLQALPFKRTFPLLGIENLATLKEPSFRMLEQQRLHPMAEILFQAQSYVRYKMLKQHDLITKDMSTFYLQNHGMKSEHIIELSKIKLTALDIDVAEA